MSALEPRPQPRGRRPVSTAETVEQAAIDMLLQRGYDNVSVGDLATAAGIGRSTFFRYFGTKAAVVCWGFDRALDELAQSLSTAPGDADPLDAVRSAIADSVRAGIDDRGVWWERFLLLDTTPSLRGEVAERWSRWTAEVAGFVADRAGWTPGHPLAYAVSSAHQGVYLASLRSWPGRPGNPEEMLEEMLSTLEAVGDSLRSLLDHPG